jgi:hypothetical protein
MVYNTQNHWVFGLCPSSGILKAREHNISETLIEVSFSKRPNKVGVSALT